MVEPVCSLSTSAYGGAGIPPSSSMLHAPRPERAEVQPHGRRAGAAVEGEHERPVRGVGHALERVGHVEDRGLDVALVRLDGQPPDRRRVAQRPSAGMKLVVRDDGRLFGRGRRLCRGGRALLLERRRRPSQRGGAARAELILSEGLPLRPLRPSASRAHPLRRVHSSPPSGIRMTTVVAPPVPFRNTKGYLGTVPIVVQTEA